MPMASQSLYSQLWERGGKQMSLEFSLKYSQTLWRCDFWWQVLAAPTGNDRSPFWKAVSWVQSICQVESIRSF